jgi:cytochrome c oxidase accessory protein FixG
MDKKTSVQIEKLYSEGEQWEQNLGEKTIHAKRIPGKFRLLKWIGTLIWLPFFLLPYLDWDGRQAILFDTEKGHYHLFEITIFSQDLWVLAIMLIFLSVLLAVLTSIFGRIFCGYLCFQTVWTDIFTKIEEFIEGSPNKRRVLDAGDWNFDKIKKKTTKHVLWIMIALLSGGTWMLYFGVEWADYFAGTISLTTLVITSAIALGAYVFAGFMREQSCLWVCPYARIQGVMLDKKTVIPAYDYHRGENRKKLVKGEFQEDAGDCIDCHQCVAVCPTGVDIRKGQEYGCITCGLCIDACDSVMEKVGKPKGLILYTSLNALNANTSPIHPHKRIITWLYAVGLVLFAYFIFYQMNSITPLDFKVIQERTPLFVKLSDGSFRNKYRFKLMNKSNKSISGVLSFESSNPSLNIKSSSKNFSIKPGQLKELYVFLSGKNKKGKTKSEVEFIINSNNGIFTYKSIFITKKIEQ